MSEDPELNRIKANTKIQSNVKYHEEFEKSKSNTATVAVDEDVDVEEKQNGNEYE